MTNIDLERERDLLSDISDATGYAAGEDFDDAAQVRRYFTRESLLLMGFDKSGTPSNETLRTWAEFIIELGDHMTNRVTIDRANDILDEVLAGSGLDFGTKAPVFTDYGEMTDGCWSELARLGSEDHVRQQSRAWVDAFQS